MTSDLATRTALAITWQLDQSTADLALLRDSRPPIRIRPLAPGADIWDRASHAARREAARVADDSDAVQAWYYLLVWHTVFAYSQCAMRSPSLRDAGVTFRDAGIQEELRRAALILAAELVE